MLRYRISVVRRRAGPRLPGRGRRRARPAAHRIRRPEPGQPGRRLPGGRTVDPRRRCKSAAADLDRRPERDRRGLALAPGIALEAGDLFWYSDDHGFSWHYVTGPEGVGSPTIIGGGDSDVATAFGPQVYGTGLTAANITLAASCTEGTTARSRSTRSRC